MGYEETLKYIHNVKWQGSKPGLERTKELLAKLGNPERALKFVHVAGTNGKGSTAAMIASVLQKAGYRTGLYTSPYILRFNERMQVNGEHIPDSDLEKLTDEIRPFADAMQDPPTEFELITALAMKYFLYQKCDIVVLEVGMGGELDSTNVIDTPEVAVITAIGLDHMAELGSTLAAIASAKAGIIKAGGDVVIYGGEKDVEDVFEKKCAASHARLYRTDYGRLTIHGFDLDAVNFDFLPYKSIRLPLVGTYQPNNAALAVTALEVLRNKGYRITDGNIIDGLNHVYWPGRFEVLRRSPVFILDGAHNPHGIAATSESLKRHFGGRKLVFLIGVMADKDVGSMVTFITPLAKAFVTVTPHNPRAMQAEKLAELLTAYGLPVKACSTIEDGVAEAISAAGEDGVVVALGSLYFSGDIREAVNALKK
ncbi:dihydrofolate synthase / folylpolyglutamate synthase [Sporobacter termitidis DSM 10068]|uniref:tetrahydrofolate synthase n=1 Tax=Sporobacter termitidis DSM 10068 TaxID=1123282 RepID=A0A1M5TQC9_9FIRM|nr:folylpolyglutamate synthase/dihydrofolate synthase family protein [Sporobacter termitidis]SHH52909.1 dihydrofolate synthase / folylpolyglutamate synthase [Sporobacter termitidis DSM 10068]